MMGCFDTFGERRIQLKVGPCELNCYAVGDKVNGFSDGIYVGYEGVVVIASGVFVAEFNDVQDKWGNIIELDKVLSESNPIRQIVEVLSNEQEHGNQTPGARE
jgi:hypothetical protein